MTGRFKRPCLTCGELTRDGSYCDTHKPVKQDSPERKKVKASRYNAEYQKVAKKIRQQATQCWICGGGPRANDPFEADHIIPGSMAAGLAPAHRTCNRKKSDTNNPPLGPGGRGRG